MWVIVFRAPHSTPGEGWQLHPKLFGTLDEAVKLALSVYSASRFEVWVRPLGGDPLPAIPEKV